MRLITFLGTNKYQTTTYRLKSEVTTMFFSLAMAKEFSPEVVSVFATNAAKARNWDELLKEAARLQLDDVKFQLVEIPDGKTEAELWGIFDTLTESVTVGERVLFDITHGLRSLPVVMLLGMAYLRFVKKIDLAGIYYGAFEAAEEGITPAFELTRFIELLDWLVAASAFTSYGDAAPLGSMLQKIQNNLRREQLGDPSYLSRFGRTLEALSLALLTGRPAGPGGVQELSSRLHAGLKESAALLAEEIAAWAKPFAAIMNEVFSQYEGFALAEDFLELNLRFAEWCIDRGYIMQGTMILRELFVSKVISTVFRQAAPELSPTDREAVAHQITAAANRNQKLEIASLWSLLRNMRNDLAHGGYRKEPCSTSRLHKNARACLEQLKEVFDNDEVWRELFRSPGPQQQLLITPLGLSPGLLYSAARTVQPDAVLVFTSDKLRDEVAPILERAGFTGQYRIYCPEDVHRCFFLSKDALELARELLSSGTWRITVNLTGGTTALQFLTQQAGRELARNHPVRFAAFIDTRPPAEQQADPYQVGEMIVIKNQTEVADLELDD